jgi:hypothetical protein
MNDPQRNLIEQELRQFFLGDRGGRCSRAFVAEVNKPDDERDVPGLKREFFDLMDKVINDLYMGPKPKISGEEYR